MWSPELELNGPCAASASRVVKCRECYGHPDPRLILQVRELRPRAIKQVRPEALLVWDPACSLFSPSPLSRVSFLRNLSAHSLNSFDHL